MISETEHFEDLVKLAHSDWLVQNLDHACLKALLSVKIAVIGGNTID